MSTSPIPYRSGNLLDDQVNTEFMRVCKSALPYLDRNIQKNLAISLKVLEFISVVQLYNSDTTTIEPDLSMMRGENWENRFLTDIRNSLDPDKTYIIDALRKLDDVRNIMRHMDKKPQPDTDISVDTNVNVEPLASSVDPLPSAPSHSAPFNFANLFNNMASQSTQSDPFVNPQEGSIPPSSSSKPSGPSPADMMNAFAPLLDDKQRQMLNLLSAFMKTNNNA